MHKNILKHKSVILIVFKPAEKALLALTTVGSTPRAETMISVEIFFAGTRLRKYDLLLILIYLCDYLLIYCDIHNKHWPVF